MRVSATRTIISGNGAMNTFGNGGRLAEYDRTQMSWNGNMFAPPAAQSVLYLPGHPGVGTTITDFSTADDGTRNNNHGTIVGATWSKLSSGQPVLNYDGDDVVNIADSPSLSGLVTVAINIWVYATSSGVIIAKDTSAAPNREWVLRILTNQIEVYFFNAAADGYLYARDSRNVLSVPALRNISVYWDGVNAAGHITIKINGVSVALETDNKTGAGFTPHDGAAQVTLGHGDGALGFLTGKLGLPIVSTTEVTTYARERWILGV